MRVREFLKLGTPECCPSVPVSELSSCVLYEPSVVAPLYLSSIYDPVQEIQVSVVCTDVTLLFNQSRLNLDSATSNYLEEMASKFAGEDAFKGFSDDEIISVIKSRYCQKSHEVLNWLDSLDNIRTDLLGALSASADAFADAPADASVDAPADAPAKS